MVYSPSTELEAVNYCIGGIGEAPVSSLEGTAADEVLIAQQVVKEVSRSLQATGLSINTDFDFPLNPDADGFIYLPEDTLSVDPMDPYKNYVMRGDKLYNRDERTYKFTEPVLVKLVSFLPFDWLPEATRGYIIVMAARRFANRMLGSDTLYGLTEQDERKARASHMAEEMQADDRTLIDNGVPLTIVKRHRNPRRY